MDKAARIAEIKKSIEDLQRRWPAHSVKPELVRELEDLEEELSRLTDDNA